MYKYRVLNKTLLDNKLNVKRIWSEVQRSEDNGKSWDTMTTIDENRIRHAIEFESENESLVYIEKLKKDYTPGIHTTYTYVD